MAGSQAESIYLRVNFYDKDVGERGWELHGDVILSVNGSDDNSNYNMGWCFRPVQAEGATEEADFDCLSVEFYYEHRKIDD